MTDLISRNAVIEKLKKAYWDKNLQSAKNDPCVIDAMTDWAIRQVREVPSDNPWKAGHPSECMWVLIRLENGEYGFDYWEGNRWKNHDPERYVTPRVVAWSDYVDPCKDAQ